MTRSKPTASEELRYLRKVMNQREEKDDPNDITLAIYRKRLKDDDKWILQQKRIAEKEYQDDVAAWKLEVESEIEAPKSAEPCQLLVERLLVEWRASEDLQ